MGQAGRPKAFDTVVLGGLIAGVLDGLDAVIYYGWSVGATPTRIFQHIASGLLGPASFQGGTATVALGVACHFSIAIGAAAVYYAASLLLPVLRSKPWFYGPAFGVLVYLFMHYVVVPLSLVPVRKAPMTTGALVDELISHTLFVGFPIALMAQRSSRR